MKITDTTQKLSSQELKEWFYKALTKEYFASKREIIEVVKYHNFSMMDLVNLPCPVSIKETMYIRIAQIADSMIDELKDEAQ